MAKKEFKDSVEATDFMEELHSMLNDPRLAAWADVTDDNFATTTEQTLKCTTAHFNAFINEMYEAGV